MTPRRPPSPTSAAIALAAALLAVPPPAALAKEAVPPPPELQAALTLGEALRLFRERGLDLLIAEAAVSGAEADVRIAGAVPNPAVSGTVGRSWSCAPGGCPDLAWTAGFSDQAALESWLTGKLGLKVDVARAALSAARLSRADAERTLAFQVKQQFLAALMGAQAVRFAREAEAATREMLSLSQIRFRAGAVSEADVARVEVLKLEAEQGVETALQAARQAKVALAFLLGVRGPLPEFEADEPALLHGGALPRIDGVAAAALIEEARRRRPDLQAGAFQVERARASLSLARRQVIPDVSVQAQYAQEGSGPTAVTPPTGSVGLALTLPLFYQQQGEIAKAAADLRAQELGRARLEALVASDVQGAHAAHASAQRMVQRMEARLLERARTARDLVQIQYRKGAASLVDYLDAERTYIGTQVEYLNDLTAYWTSVFQLEQAVGTELR